MSTSGMKFLIAGLGSIGRRHLQNLLSLGERDILLYRTGLGAPAREPLSQTDLAGLPVEHDLDAALEQRPDAVIIANPTALHLDVAIPAAEQGCHLLLEKPVSHSHARLDDLKDAVGRGGGQVLVGYQFRYHPGLIKVRELLAQSAIGRPLSARAHWGEYLPGWHPWEDYRMGYSARPDLGGGVVLTLSHPLDYLLWLFGEVEAVWAFTSQASDLGLVVEDNAEIGLRFRNDLLASVHLDYNQRPPAHHLEIIGTHGSMAWSNDDGVVTLYRSEQAAGGELSATTFPPPPDFERNDLFLAQMRHFLDVVRGAYRPRCTLQDGVRAMELALASLEASATGQLIRPQPVV